jgi:hypothetical protein
MSITPSRTDVKPTGNYKNPGNKLYTDLIKNKKKAFVLAHMHKDTQTKNSIVQSIYDAVRKQSPPGRFLRKNKDGTHSVQSQKDVFKKIKKALNENRASIVRYFELRGQEIILKPERVALRQRSVKLETPSLVASPRHKKSSKAETATGEDWLKLHDMLCPEEKPMKRQRLRGMLLKRKSNKKGKKISKKESKNSIENISDALKSLTFHGKGQKSNKRF